MKEYIWHGYTVRITKKRVKNTNFRIKPDEPHVIHISIPYAAAYHAALQLLEQPRMLRWLDRYREKTGAPSAAPRRSAEEEQARAAHYRKRLQDILPPLFRKWERALGVTCNKITIRDTRSQWGSCSIRTKNISISVWLGAFPEDCIEYVVVHELLHLLERGHNARFYGLLDRYYPAWRSCRARLKEG